MPSAESMTIPLSLISRTSTLLKLPAAVKYRALISNCCGHSASIPPYTLLSKFSTKVDGNSHASTENSTLFFSRVKTTAAFIDKLRAKASADCLESKEKDLVEKLSASNIWDDSKIATELSQTLAVVRERLTEVSTLDLALSDITEMYEMALDESNNGNENEEIIQECYDALSKIESDIQKKEIEGLMKGKYDKIESCFLQINAGAGGTEACDWVGMLFRMYREFCKLNNYSLTIIDENINTEISTVGYRSITIRLKGMYVPHIKTCESNFHQLLYDDLRQNDLE